MTAGAASCREPSSSTREHPHASRSAFRDLESAVTLHPSWLRVPLAAGHADFHYRWLRHNCDQDRHPTTAERTACSSDLPDDLRAEQAFIDGSALVVDWAHDRRRSRYDLAWLAERAYAQDRSASPPPPSDVSRIEIAGAGQSLQARVESALAKLAHAGAALVRGNDASGAETEALARAFEARQLTVRSTHFGRIEDLRTDNTTNANTDQLGYTDAAIEPHTDQPFLDAPPRMQLLHCIRAADEGGDSAVVDALAAAAYLESIDRPAYELLTSTSVDFHRKQKSFESRVVAPILSGGLGKHFAVRYSYFTMAPHWLPFDRMEAFYRAYDRFARIVRDPAMQYRFSLRPGDFLLYDNHRMLHARTGFRGPRWVRGVYFDPV